MIRTAFNTALTGAVALAICCFALQGAQAQTQSIEDAPGYRTVPEADPSSSNGGITFGDSTLVIQAPGNTSTAPAIGGQGGVQPGSQPLGSQPTIQSVPPVSFTPRQLSAFAETAVQVQTVAQLWQAVIDDAISTIEATNLSQQANAEKIRAIEDLGLLAPETYARINEAARRDPELRAEIEGLYQAAVQRLPRRDAS